MELLNSIKKHSDLAALDDVQRLELCSQIREFLVDKVSSTGGHLASNLGVVELTVAIETVFDTAKDRLVFDVGHQCYVHKLLTGRQADFASLRQYGGMAGFPKPSESNTDAFVAGHASSSVSIALGMARARTLQGDNYNIIALIGDGATTGGMAYEGLNDAAVSAEPMIVILNDNAMSIDSNVGGMAHHLSNLRTKERYLGMKRRYKSFLSRIPGGKLIYGLSRGVKDRLKRMLIPTTIFENMGFTYLGPVDGHDVSRLISLLRIARDMKRPVLLHVLTQKGCGYKPAEMNPKDFHGVGKFNPATGDIPAKNELTFSKVFGQTMLELAAENNRVCAITAAMPGGTGLQAFKDRYPKRTFDVGIAEEHAVSMAGGLAKQGMIPVVAIYSSFLQRAYDMILQDVGMLGLHVVFAVDRAGLVGEDGETHHGVFDIGFLRQVPGMTILCPGSTAELRDMLTWAVQKCSGPVALRYPKGGDDTISSSFWPEIVPDDGVLQCLSQGTQAALITYGTLSASCERAAQRLSDRGISVSVLRLLTVSPLPLEQIVEILGDCTAVFVVEEATHNSAIAAALSLGLSELGYQGHVTSIDLGEKYIPHGKIEQLRRHCAIDEDSICERVMEVLKVEN